MIELYHMAFSTCSQKVRLCLAEKNLEWTSHDVTELAKQNDVANYLITPEYLAINPNGVVPTLIYDGQPIIESSAICEFLDDVFPDPPLSPADPVERARMRAWMRFIEEVPTPAVRRPSISGYIRKQLAEMSDEEREALVEAKPMRKYLYRHLGRDGFSEQEMQEAMEKLGDTARRVALAVRSGPWLNGDMYTIADACMTPYFQRLEDLGLESVWADYPEVSEWLERIQARPSFAETYYPGSFFTLEGPSITRPKLLRSN